MPEPTVEKSASAARRGSGKRATTARSAGKLSPEGAAARDLSSALAFEGFPEGTLRFLRGLAKNNSKAWFDQHRLEYEAFYVDAARSFVAALGPGLRKISKLVQYEARVNGSLLRIHRDVRFAKDKSPYKAHLDLWFWEGADRGWENPGFFFRLAPSELVLGAGLHHFAKQQLPAYREAVLAERSGKALARLADQLRAAGYVLGGATRKSVPRGFDAEHPRAALLLHEGLYAALESPLPASLGARGFVDDCLTHFRALAPVSKWLREHIEL